jgi:hypothetical protein
MGFSLFGIEFFEAKPELKPTKVQEYQANFVVEDDKKSRSVSDWDLQFSNLLKKAEADNINHHHYKYLKVFHKQVDNYDEGKRTIILKVLLADEAYEAIDADSLVIQDLLKEIELLGGGANLLIHTNEAIRQLYSSYIEKTQDAK